MPICHACQKQPPEGVAHCPYCGAPQPQRPAPLADKRTMFGYAPTPEQLAELARQQRQRPPSSPVPAAPAQSAPQEPASRSPAAAGPFARVPAQAPSTGHAAPSPYGGAVSDFGGAQTMLASQMTLPAPTVASPPAPFREPGMPSPFAASTTGHPRQAPAGSAGAAPAWAGARGTPPPTGPTPSAGAFGPAPSFTPGAAFNPGTPGAAFNPGTPGAAFNPGVVAQPQPLAAPGPSFRPGPSFTPAAAPASAPGPGAAAAGSAPAQLWSAPSTAATAAAGPAPHAFPPTMAMSKEQALAAGLGMGEAETRSASGAAMGESMLGPYGGAMTECPPLAPVRRASTALYLAMIVGMAIISGGLTTFALLNLSRVHELLYFSWIPVLPALVFQSILIFRAWAAISDSHSSVSPGAAVGLLFVPFFNLYWLFIAVGSYGKHYNAFAKRNGLQARASEGLFLTCAILTFVPPASLIAMILVVVNFCAGINALAAETASPRR